MRVGCVKTTIIFLSRLVLEATLRRRKFLIRLNNKLNVSGGNTLVLVGQRFSLAAGAESDHRRRLCILYCHVSIASTERRAGRRR